MTVPKRKIAFLKQGSFSHINRNIEEILQMHFPESELVVVDIEELLSLHRRTIVANVPWFMREYGISPGKPLSQHRKDFYRTSYLFRKLKTLVNQIVRAENFLFSFQTQSLFDLSTPNVPHYVYTDHAILSNLTYPKVTWETINALYPQKIQALEKTIYQNATMTFTMGDFVARTLTDEYGCPADRVACVGGGSNLAIEPRVGEKLVEPDYAAKKILFIGVVWERKGGVELVAAFDEIRKRHPTATLTIVGCQPDVDIPGCHIVGRVPLAEVDAYSKDSSIFCMPSHREPFGIAYLEASANRLPVVATTVGAIPDIVHHNKSGLLIEPGDTPGLVAALDCLLSDPARCKRYGDYGYEHVSRNFTWTAVGTKIADHIRATL